MVMEGAGKILEKLRGRGHRSTKARRLILELFISSDRPLSSADLRKMFLLKKMAVNKTTVYRELEFLAGEKIIEEIQLGKIRYFEIPKKRHHHLVCLKCRRIECLEPEKNLLKRITIKNKDFKILNYSLEIFGLCLKCK